ncbi:unnamed protein product, partial [Mesorhabditis spiculigera]
MNPPRDSRDLSKSRGRSKDSRKKFKPIKATLGPYDPLASLQPSTYMPICPILAAAVAAVSLSGQRLHQPPRRRPTSTSASSSTSSAPAGSQPPIIAEITGPYRITTKSRFEKRAGEKLFVEMTIDLMGVNDPTRRYEQIMGRPVKTTRITDKMCPEPEGGQMLVAPEMAQLKYSVELPLGEPVDFDWEQQFATTPQQPIPLNFQPVTGADKPALPPKSPTSASSSSSSSADLRGPLNVGLRVSAQRRGNLGHLLIRNAVEIHFDQSPNRPNAELKGTLKSASQLPGNPPQIVELVSVGRGIVRIENEITVPHMPGAPPGVIPIPPGGQPSRYISRYRSVSPVVTNLAYRSNGPDFRSPRTARSPNSPAKSGHASPTVSPNTQTAREVEKQKQKEEASSESPSEADPSVCPVTGVSIERLRAASPAERSRNTVSTVSLGRPSRSPRTRLSSVRTAYRDLSGLGGQRTPASKQEEVVNCSTKSGARRLSSGFPTAISPGGTGSPSQSKKKPSPAKSHASTSRSSNSFCKTNRFASKPIGYPPAKSTSQHSSSTSSKSSKCRSTRFAAVPSVLKSLKSLSPSARRTPKKKGSISQAPLDETQPISDAINEAIGISCASSPRTQLTQATQTEPGNNSAARDTSATTPANRVAKPVHHHKPRKCCPKCGHDLNKTGPVSPLKLNQQQQQPQPEPEPTTVNPNISIVKTDQGNRLRVLVRVDGSQAAANVSGLRAKVIVRASGDLKPTNVVVRPVDKK